MAPSTLQPAAFTHFWTKDIWVQRQDWNTDGCRYGYTGTHGNNSQPGQPFPQLPYVNSRCTKAMLSKPINVNMY